MFLRHEEQPQQRIARLLKLHPPSKVVQGMKQVREANLRTQEKVGRNSFTTGNLPSLVQRYGRAKLALPRVVCTFCGARQGQPCKTATGKMAKKSHAERTR